MRLEQSFEVPVPVAQAWSVLLDVERIAPCMPGATLTGFDGTGFTGNVKVKLGPVSLAYKGSGRFTERDEPGKRVVIVASGQDSRGAGGASARVTAVLHSADGGSATLVKVVADLDIAGRAAQFGRGMIADVSGKLVKQFADCLAQTIAGEAAPAAAAAAAPPVEAVPAEAVPAAEAPTQAAIPAPEVAEVPAPERVPEPAPEPEYHPLALQEPEPGAEPAPPRPSYAAEPVGEPVGEPEPAAAPQSAYAYEPEPPAATPEPAAPAPAQPVGGLRRPPAEAEPIDLLAISGAKGMARRAAPYLLVVVLIVVAVVIWLIVT